MISLVPFAFLWAMTDCDSVTGQSGNVKVAKVTFLIKSIKTNKTGWDWDGPEQRSVTSSSGRLWDWLGAGEDGEAGGEEGSQPGGGGRHWLVRGVWSEVLCVVVRPRGRLRRLALRAWEVDQVCNDWWWLVMISDKSQLIIVLSVWHFSSPIQPASPLTIKTKCSVFMNKHRNCFGLLLDLLLIATKCRMKSEEKNNLCYEGPDAAATETWPKYSSAQIRIFLLLKILFCEIFLF